MMKKTDAAGAAAGADSSVAAVDRGPSAAAGADSSVAAVNRGPAAAGGADSSSVAAVDRGPAAAGGADSSVAAVDGGPGAGANSSVAALERQFAAAAAGVAARMAISIFAGVVACQFSVLRVIRLRLVCKEICQILSSANFIEEHARQSSLKSPLLITARYPDAHFLDQETFATLSTSIFLFENYTDPKPLTTATIRAPFTLPDYFPPRNASIPIQSCCGLVCFPGRPGKPILISNPSTREITLLPPPPSGDLWTAIGFGISASSADPKVVRFSVDFVSTSCNIFTIGVDANWRTLPRFPDFEVADGAAPYLKGFLHVLPQFDSSSNYILVFDLENEECTELNIPLPDCFCDVYSVNVKATASLMASRGSLFLATTISGTLTLRMLTDYQRGVWQEFCSIHLNTLELPHFSVVRALPLAIMNDRSVLITAVYSGRAEALISYHPDATVTVVESPSPDCNCSAAVFVETLLPLRDVNRLITRPPNLISPQRASKVWPFKVTGFIPRIAVNFRGEQRQYTPKEILSMVLLTMKEISQAYFGSTGSGFEVTIPEFKRDFQIQRSYKIMDIISPKPNALIVDIGGGSCDVTLLAWKCGILEAKATCRGNIPGEDDFLGRMVNHFVQEMNVRYKSIVWNATALRRLTKECERASLTLLSKAEALLELDSLLEGVDFYTTITRSRCAEISPDLLRKCEIHVEKCLRDASMEKSCVHELWLIGGSIWTHILQKLLHEYFNGEELFTLIKADEVIPVRALVQAAILSSKVRDTVHPDPHSPWSALKSEHAQKVDDPVSDVTPLSLGLESAGGVMTVFIPRNSAFPIKQQLRFSACRSDQCGMLIQVYEGESVKTRYNNFLGKFRLSDIVPSADGSPTVAVCFEIDANGRLNVSAEDETSGVKDNLELVNVKSRYNKQQIDMIDQYAKATKDKVEDQKAVEALRFLECYASNVGSSIEDLLSDLPAYV